jgi:hypothetical protein
MDQPVVIFLHIPKAAGTTLNHIIKQNCGTNDVYSIHRGIFDGEDDIEVFKRLSPERRAQIRLLTGHLPFGLHEYLPGPATYFTLLREPIDRVISFYYYVRQNPQHYLHDYTLARDMSLRHYVESRLTTANDNFQVRMLSGIFHQVPYGQCTPDLLDLAKHNLQNHFAVVGLSEQFDATLLLLKRAFHWRNIFYVRQNVTPERLTLAAIPADTLELIRNDNLLDIELYRYAKELFEAQLKQAGHFFTQKVRLFQAANRRYQTLQPLYAQLRQDALRAQLRWRLRQDALRAQLRWHLRQDALHAQQLAARQSSNQRLQPVLRLYWLARQYSMRAWIRGLFSSRHDTP